MPEPLGLLGVVLQVRVGHLEVAVLVLFQVAEPRSQVSVVVGPRSAVSLGVGQPGLAASPEASLVLTLSS